MARRWAPLAAGLLALAAACSDGGEAAPLPPPTTPAVTATTTTTLGTTTTTEDPEIAAVREAHLAYLAMLEVVGDPPNPDHPEIALRATGDAYERLRANLAEGAIAGHRLIGGYLSSIETISVQGDQASVTDCMLDTGTLYDSTGQVLIPADETRALRTTRLTRIEDAWKVWRLDVPKPPESCEA